MQRSPSDQTLLDFDGGFSIASCDIDSLPVGRKITPFYFHQFVPLIGSANDRLGTFITAARARAPRVVIQAYHLRPWYMFHRHLDHFHFSRLNTSPSI